MCTLCLPVFVPCPSFPVTVALFQRNVCHGTKRHAHLAFMTHPPGYATVGNLRDGCQGCRCILQQVSRLVPSPVLWERFLFSSLEAEKG